MTRRPHKQFVLYSGNEQGWGWNIYVRIASTGGFRNKGCIYIKPPSGNNILVEHHIKYKEIHGVDETIWITKSQHIALHKRLRREGICNFSPEELQKISDSAYHRTPKYKIYKNKYMRQSIQRIDFSETMGYGIKLCDGLTYNLKTGSVGWYAYFRAEKGKKVCEIMEMPKENQSPSPL